jgi:sugar-specific transcriptional regulator TrmB
MNLIDLLRLDIGDIEKEYRRIASSLEKLGLSEYEARSFVALVLRNHGTAEEVAELAMMPRTSAYKALDSLVEKGFATSVSGRPTTYHPKPLEEVRDRAIAEFNEVFDRLASVRGLLSEKGNPQLIYTIIGEKRVLAKIGEMIEASKKSIIISTPVLPQIRSLHAKRFKEAASRGVVISVVVEPNVKVPFPAEVHRRTGLLATDMIVDGQEALIASPDLDMCGYSDSPFLAGHLESFMQLALQKAP